ncbi:AAA family ATPase [Marinobacter sp.]|uniref:AAA family ATPase n=1 Tax=Marinobacter sp. TaxID=50741 RepID=UPI002627ECC3|nr:AAA family ATPase [Marinobacter sp.]
MKNSEMPTVAQMVEQTGGWVEKPTAEVFGLSKEFSGKALQTIKVPANSEVLPFLIERNEKIQLDADDVRRFLIAKFLRRPVMLTGPKGTGKTEAFEQFYACMGLPCISVQCGPGTDSDYLFGRPDLQDGSIGWVDGVASLARRIGAGLLLDELDGLRSEFSPELNGFVVMHKPFTLMGQGFKHGTKVKDMVIPANEHFFLGATTNTGGKVEGGMDYVGRNPIDQTTLDRFYHMDKGYMEEEREVSVLRDTVAHLPEAMAKSMVQFANEMRHAHKREEVFEPVSLRSLVMWAEWTVVSGELAEGFKMSVLSQMRDHDAAFARNVYESYFRTLD